jgi:hypothetical protein
VAPLQKAGIVSLVKKRTADMTLAIGDGMISSVYLFQIIISLWEKSREQNTRTKKMKKKEQSLVKNKDKIFFT